MKMKTQTIAGHKITLKSGIRYFASRPACTRRHIDQQRFGISIRELNSTNAHFGGGQVDVITIPNLTYDQANLFLDEFNDEGCSLSGRIW
jgi:hypothetical protein